MKTTALKRTVCAALAGIILTMTSCGKTNTSGSPSPAEPEPASSNSAPSAEPDTPAPDIAMSTSPLSAEKLARGDKSPNSAFYDSYRDYAAELFRQSCTEDIKRGMNVMVSPESVMQALGMTANGANGETLSQMETALGGLGIEDINNGMQYRMNKFMDSKDVKFNAANSVWVRDDKGRIKMDQDFCDKVKQVYNADTFYAPFDNGTLNDINAWVNNNTNGMIPEVLDTINPEAVAYLINAISFEGKWAEKYEDSQIHEDMDFTNSSGEKEKVTMLYSDENGYFEDEDTTGFIKYYKGMDYAFMAMLPTEGTDLADYVANMDGGKLNRLWSSASGEVNVCIPEFSYDYGNELSDELINMGMPMAFSESADFSNMAETGTGELFINRVIHKTHIELDREGTKAAAATVVEMKDECVMIEPEPKYVYLDRPFVYAIIDTDNGTPIFIGAVNTVNG